MLIRTAVILICVLMMSTLTLAQAPSTLTGAVTGPDGESVANVPIQITHEESGAVLKVHTDGEGEYTFLKLTGGSYTLAITMPCCAYANFSEEAINVVAESTRQFDVRLEQGVSLNTLGDDPITIANIVRDRQVIPNLPVPNNADGRPDLSGVWLVNDDPFPRQPEALPWAEKVFEERNANGQRNHPHNRCLPGDPPIPSGGSPFIGKFVHTDDLLVILLEDVPGFRQVFTDGRSHPEDPNPSWMGHSTAHWDGGVLVVDTVGFNDRGWTAGYPRSEEMRMTERYQRTTYGRMVAEVTIEDAAVFTAPWIRNMSFDLAPQEEMIEYVCENNKWAPAEDPSD